MKIKILETRKRNQTVSHTAVFIQHFVNNKKQKYEIKCAGISSIIIHI